MLYFVFNYSIGKSDNVWYFKTKKILWQSISVNLYLEKLRCTSTEVIRANIIRNKNRYISKINFKGFELSLHYILFILK